MKKVVTMISLMSGILVFGACSQQEAAPSATQATAETLKIKEMKPTTSATTTKTTTSKDEVATASTSAAAYNNTTDTYNSSSSSQAPATTNQVSASSQSQVATTETSTAPVTSEASTANSTTTNSSTATTTSTTDMQSAFVEGERSDLGPAIPTDLLNAYRTTISQAGVNGATYSDEMLTQYYYAGVRYGDFGTLLQMVGRDQGIPVEVLLENYFRYNGQNADGSEAVLDAATMQAYRNCITLAGLDATSFSDEQLNGYYHEAHLSGDFGTLLRAVARDRGLDADQLVATYMANSK